MKKIPLIDVTDLYHPYQDPGDNFDIIMPYSLPEIDLKAVILDVTQDYRYAVSTQSVIEYADNTGPRDPGIIPVTQLNYLYGRNVPFAVGPFGKMKSPQDKMPDVPAFQQQGIDLIINTLRNSIEKIEIAVFSSLRTVAVAYNREPGLFKEKVGRIHICAGASSEEYLEWNVALDVNAFVCMLRSELPIAIYPCASKDGPFALDHHNCFWRLNDLAFIQNMDKKLKQYLWYAFERIERNDFLMTMDENVEEEKMQGIYDRVHNVWETAVWIKLTDRELVRKAAGKYKIVCRNTLKDSDVVLMNQLLPCKIQVKDDGSMKFELTDESTNFSIYYREDPEENEIALREALADLYSSFKVQ